MSNLKSIEDIENLRENIGFHFTPKQNLENILRTGLEARIGDNSSGKLGRSVIPKAYISYGLEGVLKLYNRLLNIPFESKIEDLSDKSHKPFLPESTSGKGPKDELTTLEAFEFLRQYMENNVYLMFDAPMTQYEHTMTDDEIKKLNSEIRNYTDERGNNLSDLVGELNHEIENLSSSQTEFAKAKLPELLEYRKQLVLETYNRSVGKVKESQGQEISGNADAIIEEVDYNDENLEWVNFKKNPHNAHTRIVDKDGKITGVNIPSETLRIFSKEGLTIGNGLDFALAMYSKVREGEQIALANAKQIDADLLGKFCEYIKLVEKYKEQGLLVERPERKSGDTIIESSLVVDLNDLSKYEGLEEFGNEVSNYYEKDGERRSALFDKFHPEKAKDKKMAENFAKSKDVAYYVEDADKLTDKLMETEREAEIKSEREEEDGK